MKKIIEKLKHIGPGIVVVAGFIGPGTVTTCFITGASYGYTLLWTVLFSTIATIIIQEMSARVGIVTQMGLSEVLRKKFTSKWVGALLAILIISAVFIGNTAYEVGNITGAVMAYDLVFTNTQKFIPLLIIGGISFFLLQSGSYKNVEKILIALVLSMSFLFILTAIIVKPNWNEVIKGLFTPFLPNDKNTLIYIAGLVGTTVVPYNIYMHSASASEKWGNESDVHFSRLDTILSISLGGLVSMCIIVSASATFYGSGTDVVSAKEMANALKPLLGKYADMVMAIGLFSASITSTITAPLSAAFATSGILGFNKDMKSKKFKFVWVTVLFVGLVISLFGNSAPTSVIVFSQAANAFLLPISVVLLMVVCNDKSFMGKYKNKILSNILGIMVLLVSLVLAIKNLTAIF